MEGSCLQLWTPEESKEDNEEEALRALKAIVQDELVAHAFSSLDNVGGLESLAGNCLFLARMLVEKLSKQHPNSAKVVFATALSSKEFVHAAVLVFLMQEDKLVSVLLDPGLHVPSPIVVDSDIAVCGKAGAFQFKATEQLLKPEDAGTISTRHAYYLHKTIVQDRTTTVPYVFRPHLFGGEPDELGNARGHRTLCVRNRDGFIQCFVAVALHPRGKKAKKKPPDTVNVKYVAFENDMRKTYMVSFKMEKIGPDTGDPKLGDVTEEGSPDVMSAVFSSLAAAHPAEDQDNLKRSFEHSIAKTVQNMIKQLPKPS